jgi:hypothetical protein
VIVATDYFEEAFFSEAFSPRVSNKPIWDSVFFAPTDETNQMASNKLAFAVLKIVFLGVFLELLKLFVKNPHNKHQNDSS